MTFKHHPQSVLQSGTPEAPNRLVHTLRPSTILTSVVLLSASLHSDRLYADSDKNDHPAAAQDPSVEVIEVIGQREILTEVAPRKLLKVAGAGNDPLRAIESLPGVVFSSGRESEPAVRGSSPSDNAYYVDFFPVGYVFHTDSSSILNDNAIGDFSLKTAAFGPEYSGATGAVIDASSRAPEPGNPQSIIDVSLLKAGFFIERSLADNQAFYLSGRQSLFQYYIENFLDDEDFRFTTVPEYYDYQGKYEYRINPTDSITVNLLGARDKAGILFADDSDQVAQDPGLSGGLNFEQYFNSQGILWDKVYGNGLIQRIGFSQLEQKLQFGIGDSSRINIKVNDYELRSQFSLGIGQDHELSWGLDYSASHLSYNGQYAGPPCDEFAADCRIVDGTEIVSGADQLVINSLNLSLADHWQITDHWSLTPGLLASGEDYTNDQYLEPRLQSRWQLAADWALTQGYGRYHNFPDNFGQYAPEFGNPDLKLPEATHYVTGIENQVDTDLLVRVEAYYKTMRRLIVGRASQSNYPQLSDSDYNNLPRYSNDASGKAWGLELFINQDLSERWYGWMSVAWSRTQRTNHITGEDFRYAYDQPLVINTVANYQWNEHWQIGLKWRLQSGQLTTPLEGAVQDTDNPELYNPVYGDLNSERLPLYHKLDARADRSFFFNGWDMALYIEALNLYGRQNVTAYEYKNADYSERKEVTDLPTIVSVGVKIRL